MNIKRLFIEQDMTDEIQKPICEELISLTQSEKYITLDSLYLFQDGKQIGDVPIEFERIPKRRYLKYAKYLEDASFVIDIPNPKPKEDETKPSIPGSELVLLLRNTLIQRANAFDVLDFKEDDSYRIVERNGRYELHPEIAVRMVGTVSFFRLHKSFFQERREVIQKYQEEYVQSLKSS